MADRFRLTLAQLNPTVGAFAHNRAAAETAWNEAKANGSDLLMLPEMFLTGYQIQDLVLRPEFTAHAMAEVDALAAACADGPTLAIGAPFRDEAGLFNAYHICQGGKVVARILKRELPNDGVFDEKRLYAAGPAQGPVTVAGTRIGFQICEDAWWPETSEDLEETGAEILLVPNGSPYARGKYDVRLAHVVARVHETGLPMAYLNMVGGQDDQLFDGASFVVNPGSEITTLAPHFDEAMIVVDFEKGDGGWRALKGDITPRPDDLELDYRACVEALRDYCGKAGFGQVLLGLSGGVDSALVAAIASDALGPKNVRCVMLPSEYTSDHSLEDAKACAEALEARYDYVPISGPRAAVTEALNPLFDGLAPDVTEENIQSRLRGLLLMALSNKFGEMLLTTGNKSEVAVGYATIYGDMSGGYNPIKDLYKTRVFDICRWRNAHHRGWMAAPEGEVIPTRIIDKPPSAELRPDQKDEDSLPPYEILDGILEMLVDQDKSIADCVAAGYDRDTVKRVEHLIYISEYKRFQAAPGARLSERAFWLDRRYPIVNRWRDPS